MSAGRVDGVVRFYLMSILRVSERLKIKRLVVVGGSVVRVCEREVEIDLVWRVRSSVADVGCSFGLRVVKMLGVPVRSAEDD